MYYHKSDSDEQNGYEVDGNVVVVFVAVLLDENNIAGTNLVAEDL